MSFDKHIYLYRYKCYNHHHHQNLEHFHHCKISPCTPLHALSSPQPDNHWSGFDHMNFVFSWIHINRTTEYIVFCVFLLSLVIIVSGFAESICMSLVRSFLGLHSVLLYGYNIVCISIHHLMDIWVVSHFWLLWTKLQQTFVYKYVRIPDFLSFSEISRQWECWAIEHVYV